MSDTADSQGSPSKAARYDVRRDANRLVFADKITWASFVDVHRILFDYDLKAEVILDFTDVRSPFPNGMTPIISLVERRCADGLRVKLVKPSRSNVDYLFERSGWYHFICPKEYPATELTIHRRYNFHRFETDQELNDTVNYLVTNVLQSGNLAKGIPQAFEWIANELGGNVLVHAETTHGWMQATVYPEHQRLNLVVCDGGIGIPRSMRKTFEGVSDLEALELAVRGQVTSKPEFGQGNGLAGSIAIVLFGSGQLSLTSSKARLVILEGKVQPKRRFFPAFPGTMIDIQIITDREVSLQQALWGHEPVSYFETHFEDDKGNLELNLREFATSFGNRVTGQRIRTMVENMLLNYADSSVTVDFTDISVISSSFADELFGKLAVTLGLLQFGRRIKIAKANPLCYSIIERIVEQRISYKHSKGVDEVEFGEDTEPSDQT